MDRASRSRLIYLGLLVAGSVALAAGWYAFGAVDAPRGPDRYVEGVVAEPRRINPLFSRLNTVDADIAALLFSGLTSAGPDGAPLPDLAERWDVTPDGLTYTFSLRSGLSWHDGRPLTARDVAFTIEQVQAPGFQGPSALATQWASVTVIVADDRTLIFHLAAPSASFLSRTALGVLPQHLLGGLTVGELLAAPFNTAPVGSGPYRLVELTSRHALLERNPSYHLGAPQLDEIELRFYRDAPSLTAALASGEVDGALFGERPTEAERAAFASRPDLASHDLPLASYTVLYLNNQRVPLNDGRLRRAIAAAIDREALLGAAPGARGLAGDGPIVPGSWAYSPGDWPNVADADGLFTLAGWLPGEDGVRQRDGEPLRLELATNADPARIELAELVAAQLGAAGVDVTVVAFPAAQLLSARLQPRSYELAIFGWETEPDPDPYGAWHTSQISLSGRNIAGYHDPETDALLEAARLTLDIAERTDLYARFSQRFQEAAPAVVLQYPARAYVYPTNLAGVTDGLLFEPASRFRDVHRWHFVGSGSE